MTDLTPPFENNETGFELQGLPEERLDAELRARTPVELLASQFLDELRQGERPSVETWARRYPLHADVIRESFPVMALLEQARLQNEAKAMRRSMPRGFPFRRLGGCELLCELGRGGMGVVFQARETSSGHVIAVKVLPWRISMVPEWQERFEEEANTAIRLRHPNIVPVYRYGQEHGYCFYTMQFINGVSLDRIVARLQDTDGVIYQDEIIQFQQDRPEGFVLQDVVEDEPSISVSEEDVRRRRLTRKSWRSFAHITMQVCEALKYAHQHQLLHNDIKPGNILLDADGRVRITDFGLSQPTGSAVRPNESTHGGTLRYMAPERLQETSDARSDLYSLGMTLYELITLQPGRDAESEADLIAQVEHERPPRPRGIKPEIPRALETIVMNCLARKPEHRYPNVDHLYADLLRFTRGQKVRAVTGGRLGSVWRRIRHDRQP